MSNISVPQKRGRRQGPKERRLPSRAGRRVKRWAAAVLLALLAAAILIRVNVNSYGTPIYQTAQATPAMPVAIVFGAGISNSVINDRVQAGVDLYKAGRVRKLLMTGDNSRVGYDEPGYMKQTAIEAGIPAADIVCDYAGFRTYDSVYRARDIFGVTRAVLVTQRFHLPRALFLGRKLGMEVVGLDAATHSYGDSQKWYDLREDFADEVAWLDVNVTHRRPRFLGEKEPIFAMRKR